MNSKGGLGLASFTKRQRAAAEELCTENASEKAQVTKGAITVKEKSASVVLKFASLNICQRTPTANRAAQKNPTANFKLSDCGLLLQIATHSFCHSIESWP